MAVENNKSIFSRKTIITLSIFSIW